MTPHRQRLNAVLGVVAGVVLIAVTISTAMRSEMDAVAWAGATVALILGAACSVLGVQRLRRGSTER
mgnify:CR=1 FL=1